MADDDALGIQYENHDPVRELVDVITFCVESVSLDFDRWGDSYVQGPGLYFVVVAGTSIADFADPMGANRWPVGECSEVNDSQDAFFETARTVAIENDGAVIVTVDGTIHEQMVRLNDLSPDQLDAVSGVDDLEYADWMGARHMSAVDTSAREEVIAAVTLSEEDGRVTRFNDGEYVDYQRHELGNQWRDGE